jgi:hypothetical protein
MLFLILISVLGAALTAFIVIARKGGKLRTTHALPREATSAFLQTSEGKQYQVNRDLQFYIGRHPGNDIILPEAPQDYMVCIFYHRRRFAFQTLSSSRGIRVNQEEMMAGYLTNGDALEVAGRTFIFLCN